MKHRFASRAAAALALIAGCGARTVGGPNGAEIPIGGSVHGELNSGDPIMAIPGRGSTYRTDLWAVALTAGEPVTIAMCEDAGSDFDPYLSIDASGRDTHTNDDSGGGYHGHGSRVSFTPMVTAVYDIYASTFRGTAASGHYTITIMPGMVATFRCPG